MSAKDLFRLQTAFLMAFSLALALACGQPGGTNEEASAPGESSVPAAPSWTRLPAPQDLPTDRPLNTAFLIVDGVYNTELTAPYDVFEHTDHHAQPAPGMRVFTVSPDGEPITTYEGLVIDPHYSFDDAPPIDVLVVPSAENSREADRQNVEMIEWVRRVGGEARYVMSLCWGAFILAEAGLLDGGVATTFPSDLELFAETFSGVDVEREASFVHDGKAITSHGGAKSFEASMYFVDHLYGEATAQGIGGGLLIPWPPGDSVKGRVVP